MLVSGTDINAVVRDIMVWLAQPDNAAWLLIFDNVDREHKAQSEDADAYVVRRYYSGGGHESILITTQRARPEQLGKTQQLGRVNEAKAKDIFDS
jgi:hypothetical protein